MLSPIHVLALLDRLTHKADVDERASALRLSGQFPDAEALEEWRAFQRGPGGQIERVTISVEGTDAALEPDDAFVPGRPYRIGITKRLNPGTVCVFFQSSVTPALLSEAAGGSLLIADITPSETFECLGMSVDIWSDVSVLAKFAPFGDPIDPRKWVFDLSDPRIVPSDLRPWLLKRQPEIEGDAFSTWKSEAALRLWSSLVDQVAGSAKERRYILAGPPTHDVRVSENDIAGAFRPLRYASEWIFADVTDQDARHLIFGSELAQTLRALALPLADAIPIALDNAKAAYRAHVQSASRETLKALADLRRAVVDETQKTVERTHDLTGALWRDLLVAAAPFVIKILPDSANISSSLIARCFLCVAALYLIGSFTAQTLVNRDFFMQQRRARATWYAALTRYLPKQEYNEISAEPIEAAKRVYDRVLVGVGAFYAALVIALFSAALVLPGG